MCALITGVRVMVLNTTFNNISVILWWLILVLLVEETSVPGENHRPFSSFQTFTSQLPWEDTHLLIPTLFTLLYASPPR
jgi:hypothetical protein